MYTLYNIICSNANKTHFLHLLSKIVVVCSCQTQILKIRLTNQACLLTHARGFTNMPLIVIAL